MQIFKKKKPRKYHAGNNVFIKDCGKILLNSDEQITFITKKKNQYDLAKKNWGFYATPSINSRLKKFKFRTAIIKSLNSGKYFIFILEKGKEKAFNKYLKQENFKVILWFDKKSDLKKLGI